MASDFFTVEAWSWTGLVTHYVLFVIDLATRRVSLCGITTHPNEAWICRSRETLLSLAFLAPDLTEAILEGRQPPLLMVKHIRTIEIPLEWNAQSRLCAKFNG